MPIYQQGDFSPSRLILKRIAETNPAKVKLLVPLYVFEGDQAKNEGFDFEGAGLYGQDAETHIITDKEVGKYPNEYVHLYHNKGEIFRGYLDGELVNDHGEPLLGSFVKENASLFEILV